MSNKHNLGIVNGARGLPYVICNGLYDQGKRGIYAYSKTLDTQYGRLIDIDPLVTDSEIECWNETCNCWNVDANTVAEGHTELWCATMTAMALREDGHDVHEIASYIDGLAENALVPGYVSIYAVNKVLANIGEDTLLLVNRDYDGNTPVAYLSEGVQDGLRKVLEGTLVLNGYKVAEVDQKAEALMEGTVNDLGEWLQEPLSVVDICTYSNDERALEGATRA